MFGKKSRTKQEKSAEEGSNRSRAKSVASSVTNVIVTFIMNDQELSVILRKDRDQESNASLLSLALKRDIPIIHSCGGHGTCGTCRVFIASNEDKLDERNEIEIEMALDRKFAFNERLACQTTVGCDVIGAEVQVRIPPVDSSR